MGETLFSPIPDFFPKKSQQFAGFTKSEGDRDFKKSSVWSEGWPGLFKLFFLRKRGWPAL